MEAEFTIETDEAIRTSCGSKSSGWLHTLAIITLMHNCVGATYEERQDERDTIQAAIGCLAQLRKEINSATINCWIVFLIQDSTYGGDEVQEHAQEIAIKRGVNIF